MVTFVASGCWHGGTVCYVAWGLVNGVLVTLSHALPLKQWRRHVPARVAVTAVTLVLMAMNLTFFQPNYIQIFTRLFTAPFNAFHIMLPAYSVHATSVMCYMAFTFVVVMLRDVQAEWQVLKLPRPVSLAGYAVVVILILLIGVIDSGQFIYVKF